MGEWPETIRSRGKSVRIAHASESMHCGGPAGDADADRRGDVEQSAESESNDASALINGGASRRVQSLSVAATKHGMKRRKPYARFFLQIHSDS